MDLQREIEAGLRRYDLHEESSVTNPMDSATYNRLIVASSLHSAMLYLNHLVVRPALLRATHSQTQPLPHFDADAAVRRILHLQLAVSRDNLKHDTPASIWVSSLYFAYISSQDLVYRDWILRSLERAEKWGMDVKKARQVLVQYRDQRDLQALMRDTTGYFLL